MSWGVQVLRGGKWLWLAPASGGRYEYPTAQKAENTADMCYPDQRLLGDRTTVRIAEIKGETNVNILQA